MKKENHLSFNHIRIRQIREAKKLSQKLVAEHLGISQSYYNDLEQGKTKLRADSLPLLAQFLHVDIRCFFETELSYDKHLSIIEEKNALEHECEKWRQENEKLRELLKEQQHVFMDYKKNNEELLTVMRTKIKTKKFYLNVLLLFCITSLFISIFRIYFEEVYIWLITRN